MTSKAMKMAVRFNMDIVFRVIEVTDFKSEVRFDLRGSLEAVVASEAVKKRSSHISNMRMHM